MSHACHCFWKCYQALTFYSLLAGWGIPCACHTERRFNVQKRRERVVFLTGWLRNALPATTACTFSTSQLPKAVRHSRVLHVLTSKCASRHNGVQTWCALSVLTWKCASRHNGVRFFDLSTSKIAPSVRCFQFFSLANVLCATTACNFSSLIWPHGSAPATLASLLFDPPEPHILGKTQCFATFLPFRAPASSFFWLFLFSDLLSSSLLFSDSSHLCFFICPYYRKFDF